MSQIDERLFAVVDTLRAVMNDEGGKFYELDLVEMYAIIDGVGSMKQEIANLTIELAAMTSMANALALTGDGLDKHIDDGATQ